MADPSPSSQPAAAASAASAPKDVPKPKPQNPALRMMGMPNLPRKLPSRNWMIFWTLSAGITAAIVYDKREKNRATAKWRRAVAPLADELISNPNQLPRKLTIYLEAPPGDGLRVTQDHFIEYVKPVLSASGMDWEFVQGRMQGDVRAAVAEKIRRTRSATERPGVELSATDESNLLDLRKRMGLTEYEGIKGDVIVGRHTWKEYVRGLHEGWLGPLDAPPKPEPIVEAPKPVIEGDDAEKKPEDEKKEEEEKKPERPPQPQPHNSPSDYASAALPASIPSEFAPSVAIPFPHRLGFSHTLIRLKWFFNRRKLADEIGRDVAAVCYAASRDYQTTTGADGELEQQVVLQHEEKDWPKSTWKEEKPAEDDGDKPADVLPPKEKIWISPLAMDTRVAERMRRFEANADLEARAAAVVVPETEIEGWMKGSLRSLWHWGASVFESKPKGPNVGNLDD